MYSDLPEDVLELIHQHKSAMIIQKYWEEHVQYKIEKYAHWKMLQTHLQKIGWPYYTPSQRMRADYTLDFLRNDVSEMMHFV